MLALPVLGLTAILAAGCSSDSWPQLGEASPTPSPSPTVIAPENQKPPAVTEAQAKRILKSLAGTVSEADAAPAIQQYLMNKRVAELQAKQLKPLRDQAKIEYLGSFAAQAGTAAVQPEKAANGG